MRKEPIIETDRLILRPLTLDDAEACYSWNSDDRVTKYMSYSTYTDISQTINWIKSTFIDEDEWIWAFVLKEENKVKYFKPSLICTGANWLIIIVLLFQQIKITAYVFSFIPIYIIIGMILMLKGGNDYLKVINKYYPAVMREYNNSEDSIDIRLENLEKKLLE